MKKLLLLIAIVFCNGYAKPPYEATWIEITKTDTGYVVYNYPDRSDWSVDNRNENRIINKLIVTKDSITCISLWEAPWGDKIDSIRSLGNESYFLRAGNKYKFKWVDKEKHIARWNMFYEEGKLDGGELYIDSLYNTYPIIDYIWKDVPFIDD